MPPPASSSGPADWNLALDLLAAEPPDRAAAALRAGVLVERRRWCLEGAAAAWQAVGGLADLATAEARVEARAPRQRRPARERALLRDAATRLAGDLGLTGLLAELT